MLRWTFALSLLVAAGVALSGVSEAGGPPRPPSAPSNLVATAVSDARIDLAWNDNSNNEDGFRLQRKEGSGGTFADLDTVGPNVTSYPDNSCRASTEYCYRVLSYNGYGDSAWSNEDCAATSGPAPPAAPSELAATSVSTSQINLSWTDNSSNEDGFKIEVDEGDTGSFVYLDTVGEDVTSYPDTGLTEGVAYCYRVYAYNTYGDSGYSNVDCATPAEPSLGHGVYLYTGGQYVPYSSGQAAYDVAQPGDEVVFGPGLYHEAIKMTRDGTAANPIVVRGEGYPRPVLDADGIKRLPGRKALLWVVNGADYNVIRNLELTHASKDYGHSQNSCGVYFESGTNLLVQDCYIHDNGHGMYAASGCQEWTLEYNEFCYNGYDGNGYYHNVYNYGWGTNIAQYNVFHHSHALGFKNRSQDIQFLYNAVFHNGLYEVDFMAGDSAYGPQDATMLGNWVVKNPDADNYTIYIGFTGRQGGTLTMVNNYFQANHPNNTFINVDSSDHCVAYNNIFDNNGYSGLDVFRDNTGASLTGSNNWCSTTAVNLGSLTGTVFGTDPGVTDWLNADFHLLADSQCINAGNDSIGLLPDEEPVYPRASVSRPVSGTIDIGPYEYAAYTPVVPLPAENLTATAQSSSSILLEWTNLATNEDGFIIECLSDTTVGWEEVGYADAGATSCLDTGLDSATTYVYRVLPYNAYGVGVHSNHAQETTL